MDLSLTPTGRVVKTKGDTLSVMMEKRASADTKVSWTKVMLPEFEGSDNSTSI